MRLLAVDTTSAHGSIAVLDEERLLGGTAFRAPFGHAQQLLPELDRLFASLGLSLSDIDAFAVAVGPGSFTGLRIGIASVEGLAFATGRPAVGVSTLEATAYHYRDHEGLVAPLLDARREEIFGALYRAGRSGLDEILEPVCERPEAFLTRLPRERILFTGSGLERYGPVVRAAFGELAELSETASDLAEEVGAIGRKLIERGEASSLGTLRAQYLRTSDAEKTRR